MKRNEFRNLMTDVSALYESYENEGTSLTESQEEMAYSIKNRIKALKTLGENHQKRLKEEADFTKMTKNVNGAIDSDDPGSGSWSDDSSKPRTIPTASLDNGKDNKKKGGFRSKVKDSDKDPLDMRSTRGTKSPEEPEGKEDPDGSVQEPDEMEEAMSDLKKNWKRLMGEGGWSPYSKSNAKGLAPLIKEGLPGMGMGALPKAVSGYKPISKPKPAVDIAKLGGKELKEPEQDVSDFTDVGSVPSYRDQQKQGQMAKIKALGGSRMKAPLEKPVIAGPEQHPYHPATSASTIARLKQTIGKK